MKREAESDVTQLEEEIKKETVEKNGKIYEPNCGNRGGLPPKSRVVLITGYNGSDFSGS
jgi:hypothetical protein